VNDTTREVLVVEAATLGIVAFACVAVVGLVTRLIIVAAPLLAAFVMRQTGGGSAF
jgi:hypothetical protein